MVVLSVCCPDTLISFLSLQLNKKLIEEVNISGTQNVIKGNNIHIVVISYDQCFKFIPHEYIYKCSYKSVMNLNNYNIL